MDETKSIEQLSTEDAVRALSETAKARAAAEIAGESEPETEMRPSFLGWMMSHPTAPGVTPAVVAFVEKAREVKWERLDTHGQMVTATVAAGIPMDGEVSEGLSAAFLGYVTEHPAPSIAAAAEKVRAELGAETVERLEMKVEHLVKVTQQHLLQGKCPKCGTEISTADPVAVENYEKGKAAACACQCGQPLTVPGRSQILTQGQRIVTANQGPNRPDRRALRAIKGGA